MHKHDIMLIMSNSANIIELFPDTPVVPQPPEGLSPAEALDWAMKQRDTERPQTAFDDYAHSGPTESATTKSPNETYPTSVVIHASRAHEVAKQVGRSLRVVK